MLVERIQTFYEHLQPATFMPKINNKHDLSSTKVGFI